LCTVLCFSKQIKQIQNPKRNEGEEAFHKIITLLALSSLKIKISKICEEELCTVLCFSKQIKQIQNLLRNEGEEAF